MRQAPQTISSKPFESLGHLLPIEDFDLLPDVLIGSPELKLDEESSFELALSIISDCLC